MSFVTISNFISPSARFVKLSGNSKAVTLRGKSALKTSTSGILPFALDLADHFILQDRHVDIRRADGRMRFRHGIPVERHRLADDRQRRIAVTAEFLPLTLMPPGGPAITCDKPDLSFELLVFERDALDLVDSLREAIEECRGRQLVERRLVALEEDSVMPCLPQAAADPDIHQEPLAWTLDLEALPCIAVDQPMDAEVAIGVIQLEIELRLAEPGPACGQARPALDNAAPCRRSRAEQALPIFGMLFICVPPEAS